MKQSGWKLLADLNISLKTVNYLSSLGFDIKRVHKPLTSDEEVVLLAQKDKRAIITFDKDFGEIYYFSKDKSFTVIVLYLKDQTVEAVNPIIKTFLDEKSGDDMKNKLILLYEDRYRVIN